MKTFIQRSQTTLIRKIMAALILLVFCTGPAIAFHPNDTITVVKTSPTETYLELKGVVTGIGNFLQEAEILVYEEDNVSLYSTELTNRMGRASIQLPLNREFRLVFSKAGFMSKQLIINTHVGLNGVYNFKYTIELFEYITELDTDLLNKPVGMVRYSAADKKFEYDEAYTIMMQEQLRLVYEKYYAASETESE